MDINPEEYMRCMSNITVDDFQIVGSSYLEGSLNLSPTELVIWDFMPSTTYFARSSDESYLLVVDFN
jgi:hypothetical protein